MPDAREPEPSPPSAVDPDVDSTAVASPHAPAPGPRGDAQGRAWPVGPIAVASAVVIVASAIAVGLLFPQRAERWIGADLRSVRVSNALGSRCQLENGVARPLPFTCGSNLGPDAYLSPGVRPRPWVVVRSEHDNCVLDVLTLEPILCRDTMIEWAFIEEDRVSIAVLDRFGRGPLVVQEDLVTGEVREVRLGYDHWTRFTGDPDAPLAIWDSASRRYRLGFGTLEPASEP